jgi:hypothetical protein
MKSQYTLLWLLLTVAIIIITIISFSDDLTIGGYTIKKSSIAENLTSSSASIEDEANDIAVDSVAKIEVKNEIDSTAQNILLIGDSMTYNLAIRLAQYAKQNGHQLHAINWDSSSTITWANTDTLDYYIHEYKPTYIFISLGANELYLKHPESRKPEVRKILQKIGDIPYVWIGPPNWKEDSGINDMIAQEVRPGSFFKSAGMNFKRKKDKIHPTRESSAVWMDSIMHWMPNSSHPFLAETPSDSIGKVTPNVIFLKPYNK